MGKFSLRTVFFLMTFIALMLTSYRFLPEFPRLKHSYPNVVLTGCWIFATIGALVPIAIKQRFLGNRFWLVLVIISMIGTWTAFFLLYFWCESNARRSTQFPGLGAGLFLAEAAFAAGFISFVLGWFVPSDPL